MSDELPEYGPAMAALGEKRRAFVLAMVENPGLSFAAAARAAGYANAKGGARVRGHHAAHHPGVQAAIREEALKRLNSGALIAAGVVIEILQDKRSQRKDRLKAAAMLLDRTGFAAAQNINVHKTVTDHSGKALMERIRALALKHGLDAERLLAPAPVIEAKVVDG